jgi:tetratricopeptide (TPR) repeat protein
VNQAFTIERTTEAEVRFCALLTEAVNLWKRGEFQSSLDVLAEAEPMIELVSDDRKGRFHNSRAAALQSLGQHDPAVIAFSGAAFHFEACGDSKLQAIVMNNAALSYCRLGNHELAHESVDKAISLVTDKGLLAEFYDQKSKICLAEATKGIPYPQDKVNSYIGRGESVVFFPPPFVSQPLGSTEMLETERPREHELIDAITDDNDAAHAWELLELMSRTTSPDDTLAVQTMHYLFMKTPEFEEDFKKRMAKFRVLPTQEFHSEN